MNTEVTIHGVTRIDITSEHGSSDTHWYTLIVEDDGGGKTEFTFFHNGVVIPNINRGAIND